MYEGGKKSEFAALSAKVVDTTGAGDCFAGYFAAALDEGMTAPDAVQLAIAAAALQVEKLGTGNAIPLRQAVENRLIRA